MTFLCGSKPIYTMSLIFLDNIHVCCAQTNANTFPLFLFDSLCTCSYPRIETNNTQFTI